MIIQGSLQQSFDEIEIKIFKDLKEGYVGELSLSESKVSCALPPLPSDDWLGLASTDVRSYGLELFSWLFRDELLESFRRVRRSSEGLARSLGPASGLRLRLWLDPKAEELRRLWWEAIRDPERDEPLALRTAFSRFLRVRLARGRPILERPLRMLCVASNPTGLERFQLTRMDMSLEISVIGEALQSLKEFLEFKPMPSSATISEILNEVKRGYHIIHILAHATKFDGQYCLILPGENGDAVAVPFDQITKAFNSTDVSAPHFVFLATPMTATESVGETLVSFAPEMVEAGAQAVLAIQSAMENDTLRYFTESFYNRLIRTGTVDTAVSAARNRIYDLGGWQWTYPVLYMRTPDAQLFHPLPD
ncbi:MAG: CHAT domain-containing protein [Blastocatellia bacterium]